MKEFLLIVNLVLSIIITALILIQGKGAGLGSAWGGGGEFYHTRRGLEKVIFKTLIVCVILFMLVSIANFFL
ncbi:MAG: hypothetical protein KatS3mg090_0905 [Patescibacteria group bacterium]|nr:MAG: hypothetical protein KatS3mg090_0905 [Patescibacteria group bacterium]